MASQNCPTCGSAPAMGQLSGADPGRQRFLSCGGCGTRWRYRRTQCPFCENDSQRFAVLAVQGEAGLRIAVRRLGAGRADRRREPVLAKVSGGLEMRKLVGMSVAGTPRGHEDHQRHRQRQLQREHDGERALEALGQRFRHATVDAQAPSASRGYRRAPSARCRRASDEPAAGQCLDRGEL
ncbi:MAG: formate dehydrogenase accessory protein FdhE [Candidatus Rokuibacteriota bacterium]